MLSIPAVVIPTVKLYCATAFAHYTFFIRKESHLCRHKFKILSLKNQLICFCNFYQLQDA